MFWQRENALIISDLHVGKSAHFRKNGIPVSSEVLLDDLQKLENLIQFFKAEKLIIVGDLFHAGTNSDLDIFCDFRNRFSELEIILIKGNHDRISKDILQKICINSIEKSYEISPFTFVHEPEISTENFLISGHIHPGILLQQRKIQLIKLPCFAYSSNQLILPAFSKFTGLDYKSLDDNFIKIAFGKDLIFEV